MASYGSEVVRNSMGTERSYLKRDGTLKLEAASWVQLEVAKKVVAAGGYDLDKLYQQAQSRDFEPVELPVQLKARVASELHPFVSQNVVAKVEGRGGKGKEEAVLYTAHYDHLGINPAMKGDNIYIRQPGDEIESARRASFAVALGQNRLFENFQQLRLVEFEPIHYARLARQTRISGQVKVGF